MKDYNLYASQHIVGMKGLEPSTPWSQTRCTTGLCYIPKIGGSFLNALPKRQSVVNAYCQQTKLIVVMRVLDSNQ